MKRKILLTNIVLLLLSEKSNAQYNDIKDKIFQYNYDFLKDNFNQEIEEIQNKNEIESKLKILNLNESIRSNSISYEKKLKEIIKSSNSSLSIAEAYFYLSIYNFKRNPKDLKTANDLIDNGLKLVSNQDKNIELKIKMLIYKGNLQAIAEKYELAKENFKKSIQLIDINKLTNLYSEEKMRSYVALGDCAYFQENFQESLGYLQKAEGALAKAEGLEIHTREKLELLLQIRIALSAYRDGQYKVSLTTIEKIKYRKLSLKENFSKDIIQQITNIGAISLFEIKDEKYFIQVASDESLGDLGKDMILKSLQQLIQAGENSTFDKISRQLNPYFLESERYSSFADLWIENNKSLENIQKYHEVVYQNIMNISKESIWRKKFKLVHLNDNLIQKIITKYANATAIYYFQEGSLSNSKSSFLKSAELYEARINENYMDDDRPVLLQQFAEACFQAENYSKALQTVENSLKFQLNAAHKKSAYFLRVKITRAMASNETNTKSHFFLTYNNATQQYFEEFPQEKSARDALYEFAKTSERLGDKKEAINKYEELLTYESVTENFTTKIEKDKTIQSLANTLEKTKDPSEENIDKTSKLEEISRNYDSSMTTLKKVEDTNAKLAYSRYEELSKQGRLKEASDFLSTWCLKNKTNFSSSKLLLNSIESYAQLQDWRRINELAGLSENLFLDDPRQGNFYFWLGKSFENMLLFTQAAQAYEKSAMFLKGSQTNKEKISAIDKSIDIYTQLKLFSEAAEGYLKKANLVSSNNEKQLSLFSAGEIFFNEKNFNKSQKIYQKIINSNLKNNPLTFKAKIGYFLSSLSIKKENISNFDRSLMDYISNGKGIDNEYINSKILSLNEIILDNFENQKNRFQSEFSNSNMLKMIEFFNQSLQRALKIDRFKLDNKIKANLFSFAGVLSQQISQSYQFAYNEHLKRDDDLKNSAKFKTNAKIYFSKALSYSGLSNEIKSSIYQQASELFSTPESLYPELFFPNEMNIHSSALFNTDEGNSSPDSEKKL